MRIGTFVQVSRPMVDKPFARKRSGGPRTAAGKAIVADNALSHGINSRLVTLSTEDPAEFEALFQGLVADFRPNGTIETLIVHRIAHLSVRHTVSGWCPAGGFSCGRVLQGKGRDV